MKFMRYILSRFKGADKISLGIVAVFMVLSILMIGSTTISTMSFWNRNTIVQAGSYVIGIGLMMIIMAIGYEIFRGSIKQLYVFSLFLLLLVYVPGLGITQFGARSWITLGFTTVQPSEIVKVLSATEKSKFLVYGGVGHNIQWEIPEQLAKDIMAYFEDKTPPTGYADKEYFLETDGNVIRFLESQEIIADYR